MKNRGDKNNVSLVIMSVREGNIKKADECYAMLSAEGVEMLKGIVADRLSNAQERGLEQGISNMLKVEKYIRTKEKETNLASVKN